MFNLIYPSNRFPEKARLNRLLRIPLITLALLKASLGGNVCNINNEIKAFGLDKIKSKPQLFKLKIKMIYYRFAYEFGFQEFISYDFENKSKKEILENVSALEYLRIMREILVEQGPEKFDVFYDKRQTYKLYSKFFKRDVVIIENPESINAFNDFIQKHKKFIVKPALNNNGTGIEFYDLTVDKISPNEIFYKFLNKKGAIVEEIIEQVGILKDFNPSSINTIRFVTFYDNNHLTLIAAGLRNGRVNSKLDNGSLGGLLIGVKKDTGEIYTQGQIEKSTQRFEEHPDSHIKYIGTKIPHWDELLDLIDEIVRIYPEKKYIGWDFAYSSKGWVLVEANGVPGHYFTQLVAEQGLRSLYSETFFKLSKYCDKYSKAIY